MEKTHRFGIGGSDFRRLRENDCYYIDKTASIGTLVRDGAKSILFTRPRRLGKTTFQSMLRHFFDIREDSRDIFSGLAIMSDSEVVEKWMNKYPVIYLTFKDIGGLSFDLAMKQLQNLILHHFQSYSFLDDGNLGGDESTFRNIILNRPSADELSMSLRLLSKLLYRHYGKRVIFILDEYDVPLANAEENGCYSQMLDAIRSMLLPVLKDCPYVEKGILTGCLRI